MLFSQMRWLPLAIGAMMLTGLFIKMSNGATYAVVPFVNRKALGAVAGIVGAGGNVGSVLAGFLFKGSMPWTQALLVSGRDRHGDLRCFRLWSASPKRKSTRRSARSPRGFRAIWQQRERWETDMKKLILAIGF